MTSMEKPINLTALKAEVGAALINVKSFACPIALRVAWHASGTYDKRDGSGGSNGATMRFEPEKSDPANAGLGIVRDMLHKVHKNHPEISEADLWTYAGCVATEFMGGPQVPHKFGRTDAPNGASCPANGRIPDASKGAAHVRDMFYRMGMNDREIVALCGAHTVGRCHIVRSGFDGPWTDNPLTFDNSYFKNLMNLDWKVKEWDGNFQYTDVATERLAMLPTDMALRTDPEFAKYARLYADDQEAFFRDFSHAYAKLLSQGCPSKCDPFRSETAEQNAREKASVDFREAAMHGSLGPVKALAKRADVHALELSSGRSALHKAAFWGHIGTCEFLLRDCKMDPNVQDRDGDTAAHDAARFGHTECVKVMLDNGVNPALRNKDGYDLLGIAVEYGKDDVVALLRGNRKARM